MLNTKEIMKNAFDKIKEIGISTVRDNANVGNSYSAKLLQIASIANKTANLLNIPEEQAKKHIDGDLHIHDLDSYNLTTNCLHIDTKKILDNGFNTGYGLIKPPKRIDSAASLSCIILQSCQNELFGGQSHYNFDNDISKYVDITRREIIKDIRDIIVKLEIPSFLYSNVHDVNSIIEQRVNKAVAQAMQIIVFNLNSMHARAGAQVPFSTVNIGLPDNKDAALVCELFLKEYYKGLGKGEQAIFPNIIFRVKKGINREPEDPYYYLFELACKVASKRMNPTFLNCDSTFNKKLMDKHIYPAGMGCRTMISTDINGTDTPKSRGNGAPITINLPRLAIKAMKETGYKPCIDNIKSRKHILNVFYKLFDVMIEASKDNLLNRIETLSKLKGKDVPFLNQHNMMVGLENVEADDSIKPMLKHCTWSIGFIGLAEALLCMFGKHHAQDYEVYEIGYGIIKHLRKKCDKYKEKYKLNFSCYATPAEGLSGRFVKIDKQKYGIIKGITDKEYYTNSFHVPVNYNISFKDKIDIEAPFHELCNGGHITYVELDRAPVYAPSIIQKIITYACVNTNVGYLGINFGIRYCKDCGAFDVLGNKCYKCGSNNIQGISRVTGYLSLDERFVPSKFAEKKDRLNHFHVKSLKE